MRDRSAPAQPEDSGGDPGGGHERPEPRVTVPVALMPLTLPPEPILSCLPKRSPAVATSISLIGQPLRTARLNTSKGGQGPVRALPHNLMREPPYVPPGMSRAIRMAIRGSFP